MPPGMPVLVSPNDFRNAHPQPDRAQPKDEAAFTARILPCDACYGDDKVMFAAPPTSVPRPSCGDNSARRTSSGCRCRGCAMPRTLTAPQILGQFNLGFIITRLGDDVFIIDQA